MSELKIAECVGRTVKKAKSKLSSLKKYYEFRYYQKGISPSIYQRTGKQIVFLYYEGTYEKGTIIGYKFVPYL